VHGGLIRVSQCHQISIITCATGQLLLTGETVYIQEYIKGTLVSSSIS